MSQADWKSDALLVPFFAIHKVYISCMLTKRISEKSLYKNAKVNNFYHHSLFVFYFHD